MNPPFITWGSLGEEQRSTLSIGVGLMSCETARLQHGIRTQGTRRSRFETGMRLAHCFPASVLTSESALPWRRAHCLTAQTSGF